MVALDEEDERVLDHLIAGGFLTPDEIKTTFLDEFLDGELTGADRARVEQEIDRRVAAAQARQQDWNGPTAFDLLDRAFDHLNRSDHVVAVHNAGFTREAAMELVATECKERGGSRAGILGGVYYTQQDVETALETRIMRLGFFAVGPDAATCDAAIAAMMPRVLTRLTAEGLPAGWNGDQGSKIEINPLEWTKRLPEPAGRRRSGPIALFGRFFGSA
ncbi:MAG TPA: hypothetical protein VK020_03035 [Microlunatus sp.]|nr:hypothetical protein [Microlunatus sp.]